MGLMKNLYFDVTKITNAHSGHEVEMWQNL